MRFHVGALCRGAGRLLAGRARLLDRVRRGKNCVYRLLIGALADLERNTDLRYPGILRVDGPKPEPRLDDDLLLGLVQGRLPTLFEAGGGGGEVGLRPLQR